MAAAHSALLMPVTSPASSCTELVTFNLVPGVDLRLSTGGDSLFVRLLLHEGNATEEAVARKKSESFSFMPFMMLGPMISYGMFPFMFANLNMLVMKAVMMNNMVLGMALFNTIRDVVFGPKPGRKTIFKNYGYRRPRPPAHEFHHPPQVSVHSPMRHIFQDQISHDVSSSHGTSYGSSHNLGPEFRDHEHQDFDIPLVTYQNRETFFKYTLQPSYGQKFIDHREQQFQRPLVGDHGIEPFFNHKLEPSSGSGQKFFDHQDQQFQRTLVGDQNGEPFFKQTLEPLSGSGQPQKFFDHQDQQFQSTLVDDQGGELIFKQSLEHPSRSGNQQKFFTGEEEPLSALGLETPLSFSDRTSPTDDQVRERYPWAKAEAGRKRDGVIGSPPTTERFSLSDRNTEPAEWSSRSLR